MRIDRGHRSWFFTSLAILALATIAYIPYAARHPGGPKGDTLLGLIYGILGAAMILFTGLLGFRKKLLLLRIGSLAWWMKGHLWLGALSLPIVFFHGGFAFGGPLTTVLMILLIVIVVSGLIGAVLQHTVPGVMTVQTPNESTYEQIERAFGNLRKDAYELVWAACGETPDAEGESETIASITGQPPKKPKADTLKKPGDVAGQDRLRQFYHRNVRPFLVLRQRSATPLVTTTGAALLFDTVRVDLDPDLHETLDELSDLCVEAREKVRQIQLHRWLHGWLLVHIPLSMALLVLMTVHALMALYY